MGIALPVFSDQERKIDGEIQKFHSPSRGPSSMDVHEHAVTNVFSRCRFAKKVDLPLPKHTLLSRTGAFNAILETLGDEQQGLKNMQNVQDYLKH